MVTVIASTPNTLQLYLSLIDCYLQTVLKGLFPFVLSMAQIDFSG